MKTQTKAIIASIMVIALALTAVSGVTYSWWSDSDDSTIDITTGGLQAIVDEYTIKEVRTTTLNGQTTTAQKEYTDQNSSRDGIQFTLDPPDGDRTTSEFTVNWNVTFRSTVSAYYKVDFKIDGDDTSWISEMTIKDTNTDISRTLGKWQTMEPGEKTLNVIVTFDADIDMASFKDVSITIVNEIIQQAAISKWSGNIAGTVTPVSAGTYEIYTGEQLAWIAQQVNNGTNDFSGCTLKLMKDIDLDSKEWTPIGNAAHKFEGTFDGQDHTISNLQITSDGDYIGLFGHITSSEIKNLTIVDASVAGREYVAVVAGEMFTSSSISNVSVIGTTNAVTVTGGHFLGGITGHTYSDISNCLVDNIAIVCSPYMINDPTYDNGDKAGCIVGWIASGNVTDSTVKNSSVTAYRDVGGAVGYMGQDGSEPRISEIVIRDVTITVNQNKTPYNEYPKDANAGPIIGRNGTTLEADGTYSGVKIIYNGFVPNEGVTVYPDVDTIIKGVSNGTTGIKVSGDGTLTIQDIDVSPTSGHAMALSDGCDLIMTVVGNCTLKGGIDGDGISVPSGTSIVITGTGNLTAIGNSGVEYHTSPAYSTTNDSNFDNKGGSGIGNASNTASDPVNTTGSITIDGLASISAYGYGARAYGIGGDGATVVIKNSTITYARGGFASSTFKIDTDYGKDEAEGGAGIGGSEILITDGTKIIEIKGGSKAAGIGARFHMPTTVEIINSTLGMNEKSIVGGNASAGIGGSRQAENGFNQYITVKISNSTVNAIGGYYGAGIGSGYDTHCQSKQPVCTIQITDSTITAMGGSKAAGIGTGYHFGALAGYVTNSEVDAKGPSEYYKSYTIPQDIGYGMVNPGKEFKDVTVTFKVNGTVIDDPEIKKYTITFNVENMTVTNKNTSGPIPSGTQLLYGTELDIMISGSPIDSEQFDLIGLETKTDSGKTYYIVKNDVTIDVRSTQTT